MAVKYAFHGAKQNLSRILSLVWRKRPPHTTCLCRDWVKLWGTLCKCLKVTGRGLVGMYAAIWIRLRETVCSKPSSYSLSCSCPLPCWGRWEIWCWLLSFIWGGWCHWLTWPVPKPSFNTTCTSTSVHLCKLVFCGLYLTPEHQG